MPTATGRLTAAERRTRDAARAAVQRRALAAPYMERARAEAPEILAAQLAERDAQGYASDYPAASEGHAIALAFALEDLGALALVSMAPFGPVRWAIRAYRR